MAVTMRDVARAAGVSPATVSRTLSTPDMVNEATRARVQQITLSLGYRLNSGARSLVPGRSGSLGLVVPDLRNPFFGSICKGAQRRARALGYTVFIADTDEDPAVELEVARDLVKQVEGIVLCSSRATDDEINELSNETPVVLANRQLSGLPSITFDCKGGFRAVMEYLVALGHRQIAYAGGPLRSWTNNQYAEALGEARHAPERGLELIELGNFPPHFTAGLQVADLAIASGATAVVAYNDLMALGIIDRLRQRGISVPDDISVTGFNDVTAMVSPNVTTVNYPGIRMGSLSIDSLLSTVASAGAPASSDADSTAGHNREIPVELVVRRSTGVVKTLAVPREAVAVMPGGDEFLDVGVQGTEKVGRTA